MKKEKERKDEFKLPKKNRIKIFWINIFFCLPFLLAPILFLLFFGQEYKIEGGIALGASILLLGMIYGGKIDQIEEEWRQVYEVFGEFWEVKGPGLVFVPLFVQKMEGGETDEEGRVMGKVNLSETDIPLFPRETKIDFKGGGTAVLKDPRIYVRVKGAKNNNEKEIRRSVYKMMYAIRNWEDAVREIAESALREYFNQMEAEEIIEKSVPNWLDKVKKQHENDKGEPLNETLREWGLIATRITISDFDWSESIIEGRETLYAAQRRLEVSKTEAKIAEENAKKSAQELGGWIEKMVERLKKGGYSKKEARKVAKEIALYKMGSETGSITDIKGIEGASSLEGLIARFLQNNEKQKQP